MIFVDSGAFIARFIEADAHHGQAIRTWGRLEKHRRPLWTTDLVVAEVINYLGKQTNASFTSEAGQRIYASSMVQMLRPDRDDELAALAIMASYADQRFSFMDRVSFVLMKRRKLRRAFSFDADFSISAFELWQG